MAQQRVAQRAADAPGLVARRASSVRAISSTSSGIAGAPGALIPGRTATPAESARTSSIRACDGVRGPAGIAPIATVRAPPPSKA